MHFLPLEHVSYLGIILVLILTGSGLPVPEEVPVILSGVAASYGQLNPWLAFLACLFGAIAGDCLMYAIGYHFGRGVLFEHRLLARHLTPEREARIEQMISQHGVKVFLVARFLVGLRSPVYLTAGILRVPFRRFLLIDLFCSTLVVGTFFWLSYAYGTRIEGLWRYVRGFEIWTTAIILTAVATLAIWYAVRMRRRKARLDLRRSQRLARAMRFATGQDPAEDPLPKPERVAS